MNFAPSPHADRGSSLHESAAVVGANPQVQAFETSALDLTLRGLRPLLTDDVTELCINSPHEAFIETANGWHRERLPFADFAWCQRLAKLIAHATRQRIDETSPLLSAWLPTGAGCVVITIRRPSETVWSLEELTARGIFERTERASSDLNETEKELLNLLSSARYEEFVRKAVHTRRNIIVSGPTGAGKTTYTKALVREIPTEERLITIEDARELVLDKHPNHVRLYYSKGDQGLAKVKPKELLEACLRLRPDRILLAELRGGEAYEFLRNVNSGHPGSITSVHAASAELAFEQLMLLVKQSPGGQDLSRTDIKNLLYLLVDVVIQFGVERQRRFIKEIWYDPHAKRHAFAASR
jgi:type IV secretion system protein VirB11